MSDDEFARREKSSRRTKGTVEAKRGEEGGCAASNGIAISSVPSRDRRKATATATATNVHPPRVVAPSSRSSSSPPPRSITPHPTSFAHPPPLSPPPSQRTGGGGGGGGVVPVRGDPRRRHLATRSLSDPIMSSRLRLDPSARIVPVRGFTKTAWDLARDGQLLPHVPIPCRVPIAAYHHHQHHNGGGGGANQSRPYHRPIPFLLSRRYARSASDSFLSSRSPVQERSVPRFSSSSSSSSSSPSYSSSSSSSSDSAPARKRQRASLGGSSSVSTAIHGSQTGTTSATTTAAAVPYDHHRLLFEELVLVTLERRLADRLARARAAESPPPSSSDKSASSSPEGGGGNRPAAAVVERVAGMGGGIRPGREMWIWSAVRRTRTRESRAGGGGGGGRGVVAAQSGASVPGPSVRSGFSGTSRTRFLWTDSGRTMHSAYSDLDRGIGQAFLSLRCRYNTTNHHDEVIARPINIPPCDTPFLSRLGSLAASGCSSIPIIVVIPCR